MIDILHRLLALCSGCEMYHLLTSSVWSLQRNLRPRSCDRVIARSIHQSRCLRFPCNDGTDEVNKLFIIGLFSSIMVRKTSDKQISRTFQGFFWSPYWIKHVMKSFTVFTSSAIVDHII